jgi:hypothetical protein
MKTIIFIDKIKNRNSENSNNQQNISICQWFSPGTPASSTTKTSRLDIAEILLKVAVNTINQPINHILYK